MTARGGDERLELIRKACGYMADDMAIAQIFGVMSSVVAAERAKLPKPKPQVSFYKAAGLSDATYHIDDEARRSAAREASRKFLVRLISYGLNNNSDLGMGYHAFMDLARELGLAS